MSGRMPTGGVVATRHVPALEALTQVHPPAAFAQALLAAAGARRRYVHDGGQVCAGRRRRGAFGVTRHGVFRNGHGSSVVSAPSLPVASGGRYSAAHR